MPIISLSSSNPHILQSKKQVNYVESDSEGEDDDDQIFGPNRRNSRVNKRRKTSPESDDDFKQDGNDDVDDHSDEGQFLRSLHSTFERRC